MHEIHKIEDLISQGYHVEIVDPNADSFEKKYRVWQDFGWNHLKAVVVDNGEVSGLQG